VGDDPGKLTATGAAQKRHARDWGRFLLSAKKEIEDRSSAWLSMVPTSRAKELGMIEEQGGEEDLTTNHTKLHERGEVGPCLDKPSGAAFSNPFTSELARDSENTSPSRCASGPASSLPAIRYSLPVTHRPSAWFGFRLRAYEAWRDLGNFFPGGEYELKNELQAIWRRNWFSGFGFRFSGFVLRKWGGLMNRIFGHRVKGCFRSGKFTSREATLFDTR
jgi:hypothetical protein